jgi:hypothetical protein
VGVLILTKEEYKTGCKYMVVMTVNTDGEMKNELQNIMIFGMILYFTNRQYEKLWMEQAWTRKVFTNT